MSGQQAQCPLEFVTMLNDIKSLFSEKMTPPSEYAGDGASHEVQYAAAALLVVCAKADFQDHPEEQRAIEALLEKTFGIDHELIEKLISYVDEDSAIRGIQQFTQLVNQHYSYEDKQVLIENLWRVAFADGRLDSFEEQYIARVAFMIDVPQTMVQRCKTAVSPD